MTNLDDAFVQAVAQTALQTTHNGTDVLLRAPVTGDAIADVPPADAGDDEGTPFRLDGAHVDAVLEVVVGGAVVGAIVEVGDGYGVLVIPEDGEEPSDEQATLEDALDELGV